MSFGEFRPPDGPQFGFDRCPCEREIQMRRADGNDSEIPFDEQPQLRSDDRESCENLAKLKVISLALTKLVDAYR